MLLNGIHIFLGCINSSLATDEGLPSDNEYPYLNHEVTPRYFWALEWGNQHQF